MLKSSALLILFVISVANCQFFYNYEEDRPEEPSAGSQNYDPSAYQYNPPSAVNQQYVQPQVAEAEPPTQTGNRRSRVRVRARNYQSDPDYNAEPEYDQRAVRQERRQARRRQRQNFLEPTLAPRVYSPSIFENVGLGEAPQGVYIPHNSFLNVLRDTSRRPPVSYPASQPAVATPQVTNYVQPSVNYINNDPQPRFFVQPPSEEEPKQTNLILPVSRPHIEYAVPTPQRQSNTPAVTPNVQARAVGTNRRSRQRVRPTVPRHSQPTVDIDSLREYTDDMSREEIPVMPNVEYAPVSTRQERRHQNRRRPNYEVTQAPRVYSPSVFEKVGLGEAPSGIYVPEDSLLNVLRNPSSGHSISSREVARQPQQLEAQPSYYAQNDYVPEVIEEEQYQPPPPPPPPARRRTSQRNRRPQSSRRAERREEYNDLAAAQPVQASSHRSNEDYEDFTRQRPPVQRQAQTQRAAVQPVQISSHRSNEDYEDFARQRPPVQRQAQTQRAAVQPVQTSSHRSNEDYEDFARQRPPVQRQAQTQRRPAAAPRQQTQAAPSAREQPSARKAKLAIAALPIDTDDDGIPGEAGVNYPTLHEIPRTSFSCGQQDHNGYYADLETSCQVVHLCQAGGVQSSFLCPNGTIFSQEKFSCQWWYKVNCNDAPRFYIKNDELYKVPEKKERKRN